MSEPKPPTIDTPEVPPLQLDRVVVQLSPLGSFLYQLMKEELPVGTLERIIMEVEQEVANGEAVVASNTWLAALAIDFDKRLRLAEKKAASKE